MNYQSNYQTSLRVISCNACDTPAYNLLFVLPAPVPTIRFYYTYRLNLLPFCLQRTFHTLSPSRYKIVWQATIRGTCYSNIYPEHIVIHEPKYVSHTHGYLLTERCKKRAKTLRVVIPIKDCPIFRTTEHTAVGQRTEKRIATEANQNTIRHSISLPTSPDRPVHAVHSTIQSLFVSGRTPKASNAPLHRQ